MPVDRLAMRQIKDILRLRHEAGLCLRQIAHSLNLSVGVVSKYLQLAAAIRSPIPSPDFTEIHQELRRKGVTIQLLWSCLKKAERQ